MRTRTVLFIPDPFAPEPLPIAVVVEAHGRTVVEPIPVLADLEPAARWCIGAALDDLREAPSVGVMPVGCGPQVVFAPRGDPFKSLPRPIYDAISRVLDAAEREKARTAIARAGAEVARNEVERLRAAPRRPVVVTEDVGHLGTQWGVGFDGPDSAPEHHVRVTSREDAFLLKSIVDHMRAEIAIREDGVQQAKGDVEALRAVIVRANNALFSVGPDIQDAEHMIECHADTATEAYRRLAVGANEAWGVLTAAVADMIEPKESA